VPRAGPSPATTRVSFPHDCDGERKPVLITHNIEFAHRRSRFRAVQLVALATDFGACDAADRLTNATDDPAAPPTTEPTATEPSFATSFRGGIPFGHFALPISLYGDRYNGAVDIMWPSYLLSELAKIKARGGKVVLCLAGSERYYKDAYGHFSMTKWKSRVSRYRNVNFSSYVKDGTIVGHYLIDEPQDKENWNGRPIPASAVEEMAKYSKQLWPGMVTIVRAEPGYLKTWSGTYRYLDAAWAQYTARRGNVYDYLNTNVANARAKGLALIVGLNLLRGGVPNLTPMSASEVEKFGSALLSSSYPCAFISWKYNSTYLSTSGMRSAMDLLKRKAQYRGTKSCRSS
jgi:hypothetical protein